MQLRFALPLVLVLSAASAARADFVTTFENFGLPAGSYLNSASPSAYFVSGGNSFNNSYDSTYGVWSGWAISSMTDNTTAGYTNQYSAITGGGAGGSGTYAVAFTYGDSVTDPEHPNGSYINLAPGTSPVSIDVTNTTYTYLSMLDGYLFSKQFGPGDFLLLDIKAYDGANGTGNFIGEVDFYLANFLNGNTSIVNVWQTIDLTSLVGAGSLVFGLKSSDNGLYGINTPAYFAVDDLVLRDNSTSHVPEPGSAILLFSAAVSFFGCRRWNRRACSDSVA